MNEYFRRWIGPATALLLLGSVYWLRQVLFPIVTGLFFAYLLSPVQHALVKRRVPTSVASGLCVFALVLVVGLYASLMLPPLIGEVMALIEKLPDLVDKAAEPLSRLGIRIPRSMKAVLAQAKALVDDLSMDSAGAAQNPLTAASSIVQSVFGRAMWALSWAVQLLLVPFFTFYFLDEFDHVIDVGKRLIPPRVRPFAFEAARRVNIMMAGFLRGQLVVSLVLAVVYSVGLSLLGVKFSVFLGILTGLINFVPYAGLTVGGALSLLSVLVEGGSGTQALLVLGLFLLVNVLDGLLITPKLLGGSVGLSAPFVIAAVLIFDSVFGFIGVLLAVPLMSTARIVLAMLFDSYEQQLAVDEEKKKQAS